MYYQSRHDCHNTYSSCDLYFFLLIWSCTISGKDIALSFFQTFIAWERKEIQHMRTRWLWQIFALSINLIECFVVYLSVFKLEMFEIHEIEQYFCHWYYDMIKLNISKLLRFDIIFARRLFVILSMFYIPLVQWSHRVNIFKAFLCRL